MTYVVMLAASVVGKMYDPLGWVALIGALVLGASRQRWWMALLLALGVTILNVVFVFSWWTQLGISSTWPSRASFLLLVFCVICGIGWLVGRTAAHLVKSEKSAP